MENKNACIKSLNRTELFLTKEYFHELYEEHSAMAYRLCMLYLKNESDAKDALQDLFLKLWEKKPKFKNKDHEKAWIIRAAKHRCLDVLKSSWHKKRNVYEPDRQQVADETEKEDSLLDQIQKLPQKYREVLYLYYYEEYSVKEISNLMVRKESTIQSRLAAARQKLKNILEESEGDPI